MRATDEGEAATERAEERDSNSAEYEIVKGWGDYVAWVKAAVDAKPKRFKVTGEAVPQYHAEEIEDLALVKARRPGAAPCDAFAAAVKRWLRLDELATKGPRR